MESAISETVLAIIIVISPFIILFLVIAGIVIITNKRKKRRKTNILNKLPFEPEFVADIRINTEATQNRFFKFKSYTSCGILYIYQDFVYVEGYNSKNIKHAFNFRFLDIRWIGMEFQNGLIEWFKMTNTTSRENLYINIDTGLFVFQLSGKMTTSQLYNIIKQEQLLIQNTPPKINYK